MKKLAILTAILLIIALCGFVFRQTPEENPLPVRMTVADGNGTEVSAEDTAAIREVFDLYLSLRAGAAPAMAQTAPDGDEADFTVCFYESAAGGPFGVRMAEDGSFWFFGEEEQNEEYVFFPVSGDEDAEVLKNSVRARLDAARDQPILVVQEPAAPAAFTPVAEEPAVGEEYPVFDAIGPLPEESAEDTAPAVLDGDASAGPEEDAAEPVELPADITELLGSYDLALGGARVVDYTVRTDSDTPPLWSEETEHVGAEVAVYYARGMDQYELRWQRWWTDGTHTESAAAEEFENARAFCWTATPGFTEGLTVDGWDAFCYDFSGDMTVLWYDADRDLIFGITAFAGGVGGVGDASLQTLLSLAESVSG